MTAAAVNDITIEYESYGPESAEPLLLVMGLGGQLVAWPMDWVQRWVDLGLRVIRFDERDVGLSTHFTQVISRRRLAGAIVSGRIARSEYLIDDMADDAAALLDHLGIARAHVVGVSMGGMITQALAIRHPERVATMTSIMSAPGDRRSGRPKVDLLRRLVRLQPSSPEEAVEKSVALFRLISGPHFDADEIRSLAKESLARDFDPMGTARQLMAIMASPDRTPGLARLDIPALVIHGLLDPLVRPSGGVATARAIPGSRLLMFPDMGHDLPRPRWDEIIEAIHANIRRARPAAA
jgi:pimeloyl-ACP methyl ester carboxylesterase